MAIKLETLVTVMNFAPSFCSSCGEQLRGLAGDPDWVNHASHSCPMCGMHFQFVKKNHILEAAEKSDGDMSQYVDGES